MVPSCDPPAGFVDGATLSQEPGRTTITPSDVEAGRSPPLAAAALAAVQAERERIARTLHDTVSQTLTGTYLLAISTARKLEANHSEAAGDVARLAEKLHQAVVELQGVARGL